MRELTLIRFRLLGGRVWAVAMMVVAAVGGVVARTYASDNSLFMFLAILLASLGGEWDRLERVDRSWIPSLPVSPRNVVFSRLLVKGVGWGLPAFALCVFAQAGLATATCVVILGLNCLFLLETASHVLSRRALPRFLASFTLLGAFAVGFIMLESLGLPGLTVIAAGLLTAALATARPLEVESSASPRSHREARVHPSSRRPLLRAAWGTSSALLWAMGLLVASAFLGAFPGGRLVGVLYVCGFGPWLLFGPLAVYRSVFGLPIAPQRAFALFVLPAYLLTLSCVLLTGVVAIARGASFFGEAPLTLVLMAFATLAFQLRLRAPLRYFAANLLLLLALPVFLLVGPGRLAPIVARWHLPLHMGSGGGAAALSLVALGVAVASFKGLARAFDRLELTDLLPNRHPYH